MLEEFDNIEKPPSIPELSRKTYERSYNNFIKWTQEHNIETYTEDVLLKYLIEMSKTVKCSTLWSQYSKIKAELNVRKNIKNEKYRKVLLFLKSHTRGYQPKKSKGFTKQQLENFLNNAPNIKYLATKVILIFGVAGGCRSQELIRMKVSDVEDLGKLLYVKIPNSPTNRKNEARSFTINNEFHLNLYREYVALRPNDINLDRLFIKYIDGKCHRAVMGEHKIAGVIKEVAMYLNLPNLSEYTGYTFRKTSASLLTENPDLSRKHIRKPNSNFSHVEDCDITIKDEIIDIEDDELSAVMDDNDDTNMSLDNNDEINSEIKLEYCSENESLDKPASFDRPEELDSNFTSHQNNEIINDIIATGGLTVQNCTNCTFNITIVRNNN